MSDYYRELEFLLFYMSAIELFSFLQTSNNTKSVLIRKIVQHKPIRGINVLV